MKKLLILMLTVVVTVSLTACTGAQKEAYDLYLDMNKAMEGITSVEMEVDSNISMDIQGQAVDMKLTGTAREIIRSQTDIDMEMVMDMTFMGQAMTSTSYFKDGYLYQEVAGMKQKSAMDLEQATAMGNAMQSMQFEKDAVLTSSVTDVDDDKELAFTLSGDKVTEIMNAMVGSTLDSLGAGDVAMEVGDLTYSVIIGKDNLAKSADIAFTMTMEVEGETVGMEYQITQVMTAYDTLTEISFPADLADYPEA